MRFGRFDTVLAEPQPAPELRYATAFWHYARGIALARLGRAAEADAEQAAFAAIAADPAWEQTVWVEGPLARRFEVARHHLAGELAGARGDRGGRGRASSRPPSPPRTSSTTPSRRPSTSPRARPSAPRSSTPGGPADAEAVYRKDLAQYPKNGWSLFGLAEALRAQKKTSEARWAEQGFARAWARADVKLSASRF